MEARRIGGRRMPARRTQKPAKTCAKAHCTGTSRRAKRRAHSKCAICTITVHPHAAERHTNHNGVICMGVFHKACLDKWLSLDFLGTCPNCRNKVLQEVEMDEVVEWEEYLTAMFEEDLNNHPDDIEMLVLRLYPPEWEYAKKVATLKEKVQGFLSRAREEISNSNVPAARDALKHVETLTCLSYASYLLNRGDEIGKDVYLEEEYF